MQVNIQLIKLNDVVLGCLAYYSFDCHLLDGSPFSRNGLNVNGVVFDPSVTQKNFSALFNGSNYISVKPFRNVRFGTSSIVNMIVVRFFQIKLKSSNCFQEQPSSKFLIF